MEHDRQVKSGERDGYIRVLGETLGILGFIILRTVRTIT
jgi:hypothetical protein